ncbi:MAG: YdgA family protein [Rhizobiales bacterium]|nr:YdgA family protein [Hyphomicrobiales bacterium]
MKNKKLLSLGLIVVLFLGITPYFVGNMARGNIEKQAALLSQIPGYTLKIHAYDQGWFTSHVAISYGFDEHTLNILKDSKDVDQNFFDLLNRGLTLDLTVAHGPVTFQNGLNFALLTLSGKLQDIDNEAYREFKAKTKIDSLAKTFVSVSYGGTTSIKAHSPSFKADYTAISGKKLIIHSAGMEMQATINAALDEYDADMHMDELSMEIDDSTIVLNKMNIRTSGFRINDYIWSGKGSTSIGKFSIISPKDLSFSLRNLNTDYNFSRESDAALAFHGTFNVKTINANKTDLKDIQLSFDLKHLDIEALIDYVKSIKGAYQSQNEEIPTPEQTAANIQVITTRVGQKLIKGSPELIVHNLNFLIGEGYFESDGKMSINGKDLDNIELLSDPVTLNKRLAATVKIKFNEALARALTTIGVEAQLAAGGVSVNSLPTEQLEQMINVQTSAALQTFIAQGYIQLKDDVYSAHLHMKDGQGLINGKPLPIPGL